MITQVRLDERLIHGEVTTKWINFLHANRILAVDDEVAGDAFQSNLLKMGVPKSCKCLILSVEKAIDVLNDPRCEGLSLFVLVRPPQNLLKLVEGVPGIEEVNIANYGYLIRPDAPGKKAINRCLAFDQNDIECIKKVQERVSSCYHQVLSDTAKVELDL